MVTAFARVAGMVLLFAAFWVNAEWSNSYLMSYGSFVPSQGDVSLKLNLLFFILPATVLAARILGSRQPGLLTVFDRLAGFRRVWPWAVGMSLAVLALVAVVRFGVLRSVPITDDENVYEFQARIFASGRLYLDSLPSEVRPFFNNQFVVNDGKWYGLYFTGHPSLLALAYKLGLDEWLGPIEAALTVLLACGIARMLFGCRTAVLTGALLAVSPFFIALSASHLSQPSSSLMLSLFVYAVVRLERTPRSAVWWGIAAAAVSYAVMIRPHTAVTFSLPFLVVLGFRWWRGKVRVGVRGPMVAGLILSAGAAAFLFMNHALTGDAFRSGYHAYLLDKGIQWPAPFGPYYAIREMSRAVMEVNVWQFGWPASLMFVPFFERRGLAWVLAAAPLSLVIGYGLVGVPSVVAVGPVYYGECIVPLAILTASGMEQLVSSVRGHFGDGAYARGVLTWPVVATVTAFMTFIPAQLASLSLMAAVAQTPYDLAAEKRLDNALVFVQDVPSFRPLPGAWVFFHRNPKPDLSDRVLFVNHLGAERDAILARYFPRRAPYVMHWRKDGVLIVEPLEH
jgi:hypothetical protein